MRGLGLVLGLVTRLIKVGREGGRIVDTIYCDEPYLLVL